MRMFREPSQWLIWGIGIFVVLFIVSIAAIAMGPPPVEGPQNGEQGLDDQGPEDDVWWSVTAVPADTVTLVVGGERNLYARGVEDGAWQIVEPDLEGYRIRAVARDADGVTWYATGDQLGVIGTDDAGSTWSFLVDGLSQERPLETVTAHPTRPNELYAWIQSEGLYVLESEADAWERRTGDDDLPEPSVWALLVVPGDQERILGSGSEGLLVSHDGGHTWETQDPVSEGSTVFGFSLHPDRPDRVWAATFDALYRSDDGGVSWEGVDAPELAGVQWIDVTTVPDDPEHILAIVVDGQVTNRVVESRDGGETWEFVW